MRNPGPRMRMLDGFNEGWIHFQDDGRKALKGQTDAIAVIGALVANAETRSATELARGSPYRQGCEPIKRA